MGKIPMIIKNRLIERLETLKNDIEAYNLVSEREGLYLDALEQINNWQEKEKDEDFLEEVFIKKKSNVYIALRCAYTDITKLDLAKRKDRPDLKDNLSISDRPFFHE